ncbi:DUF6916 family protein [Terasakiella pusilla]|uniref:DUF6916 family protein n=1 Tax=Terasakiella pusilla TaxID=64973 RepID=UPI003AA91E2C
MSEKLLLLEDFQDKVQHPFVLELDEETQITFTLTDCISTTVQEFPDRKRDPFHLIFTAPKTLRIPQGTYPLTHDTLGQNLLFLVPVGEKDDTIIYQVIFS